MLVAGHPGTIYLEAAASGAGRPRMSIGRVTILVSSALFRTSTTFTY
jgi:hypothetical protein